MLERVPTNPSWMGSLGKSPTADGSYTWESVLDGDEVTYEVVLNPSHIDRDLPVTLRD